MSDESDPTVTLKTNPAVTGLDLSEEALAETLEQFVRVEESQSIEIDDFLAYLRERGVIDASSYVKAASNVPLDLEGEGPLPDERSRYRVLGSIGTGGMAEVRVAHDEVLRRNVAIKILHPSRRENPSVIRRFIQEAKITGRLDHPNIVPVHGLHADSDGLISFTMKLVQGRTLKEVLQDVERDAEGVEPWARVLSLRERLEAFARVCEAVHYAHDKGVVHRDLKPSNIMIGGHGEIYVMDWGIAKLIGEPDDVTELRAEMGLDDEMMIAKTADGKVVGTPAYMAPEQARGLEVDPRSDVYALGAILYELVTLQRLVPGRNGTEVLTNVIEGEREPVPRAVGGVRISEELTAIIEKATALAPNDRYQSTAALADDLRRFLADEETEARPDNWLRGLLRWIGHHRQLALVAFLTVTAALAVVTAGTLWQQKQNLQAARQGEQASNALISHTAERAHAIDAQFVLFESAASTLARDANLAMQRKLVADLPPHRARSFDSGEAPPSTVDSEAYEKEIALDRPAYKLPPGSSPGDFEDAVRAMGALGPTFHHIFTSVGTVPEEMSLFEWIARQGAPIRWAYVGTSDGIMVSYPAKGGYPEEYDPRKRPWYELGEGQEEVVWGNVYIDLQGQGMVLPAVTGVWDDRGGFRGVAGIETTFDWLIERFMKPEPPITQSYLVDDVGRVVIKSSDLGRDYGEGNLHTAANLPSFDVPEAAEKMQTQESGLVRTREGRAEILVSFQRIPTIGWYYVERAPLEELIESPDF